MKGKILVIVIWGRRNRKKPKIKSKPTMKQFLCGGVNNYCGEYMFLLEHMDKNFDAAQYYVHNIDSAKAVVASTEVRSEFSSFALRLRIQRPNRRINVELNREYIAFCAFAKKYHKMDCRVLKAVEKRSNFLKSVSTLKDVAAVSDFYIPNYLILTYISSTMMPYISLKSN